MTQNVNFKNNNNKKPEVELTSSGMLDSAVYPPSCTSVTVYSALMLGSSIQGNARLASTGWNFDDAMCLKMTS